MSGSAMSPRAPRARTGVPIETWLFAGVAVVAIVVFAARMPAPPLGVQIAAIAVLAGALGLPHGALDPLIARRLGLWHGPAGFAAFNALYLGTVVVVIALWLLAPVAGLAVFLAVSAVHFGADWNVERPRWMQVAAGVGLLCLPALGHRDEVGALYEVLAPGGSAISTAQFWIAPVALVGMLVGAAAAVRRRPHQTVELILAAALGIVAPPLVFFVIYFCALHSARHLREGFGREARGRITIAVVALYTAIPVIAVVVFLISVSRSGAPPQLDERLLQVVFIGLAGLTVPHMILVGLDDRAARRDARPVGVDLAPVR